MKILIPMAALAVFAFAGCDKHETGTTVKEITPKTTDLGTGLNTVERTYPKPPAALFDIVVASVTSFDLTMESDRHDALGGDIVARRADGSKVTVKISSLDAERSQVAVRVAPGNRNLAELIHQRISEKLGLGSTN